MKKFKIVILTCLVALTISSCGEVASTEEVINEKSKDMIVSNYDRDVLIDKKPTKVLTLGPNCTELFVALGLEDLVVGRSLISHSIEPLEEYKKGVESIPILNYKEATRESVLTSGADFIYAIDWEISDTGCNIDEVNEYGMDVYVNKPTTYEEEYKEIEDIGIIFGISPRAKRFVVDQKIEIEKIENQVKDKEVLDVLVYDSGNNGVFTCSGYNFENELIESAGGKNIFSDIKDQQWITVSYDEILARNPDIILIHEYDNKKADEKIKEIKANPVLKELDCVKNDKFAVISLESVMGGPRMAYAVKSLATSFHPDAF